MMLYDIEVRKHFLRPKRKMKIEPYIYRNLTRELNQSILPLIIYTLEN